MIEKIDSYCSYIEYHLSRDAGIPIFGTISAVIKIALGALQFCIALTLAILSLLFICCECGRSVFKHSCRHMVHGFANIFVSIFEAIPLVGTYLYSHRISRFGYDREEMEEVYRGNQAGKFIGYHDDGNRSPIIIAI